MFPIHRVFHHHFILWVSQFPKSPLSETTNCELVSDIMNLLHFKSISRSWKASCPLYNFYLCYNSFFTFSSDFWPKDDYFNRWVLL